VSGVGQTAAAGTERNTDPPGVAGVFEVPAAVAGKVRWTGRPQYRNTVRSIGTRIADLGGEGDGGSTVRTSTAVIFDRVERKVSGFRSGN
jgi:hypothetical protein